MAVAGGVTVAYLCGMVDGELVTLRGTSTLRSQCVGVEEAVRWLVAGQQAIVAGADMSDLRAALKRPHPSPGFEKLNPSQIGEGVELGRSGDNCILSSDGETGEL